MPRTLAVAEALSAQQNLDQAMEAASTAAMGFKAGWIPGFPRWWRCRLHQEWYIDMPFLLEVGRGWKDDMLWKWNCWCSCFVPFINAGYFFPAQRGCLSSTKESWSIAPCLVFGACLFSEPIISTVSIHRSIYPIHLSSSIHLYPSICPCIHVSNVSKGRPKCLVELVDFSRNPKRYHVCCPCQAAKCGLGEAECLLFGACGLGTSSMCVCVCGTAVQRGVSHLGAAI